ncbi:MAG: hypothetical protein J1F02_11680 [Lachnospiraceae bacterium]|nr:hypothetical protein [Lachnospiraceae bacterium]
MKNSKADSSIDAIPTMHDVKTLQLKGESSIIVTIYPSIMENNSYLIELFDNGIIETWVGKVTKEAFYGEYAGEREELFREIVEKKQRTLTKEEVELINQMVSRLDLTEINKKNSRKEVGDDAEQEMIWIGKRAYYYCGIIPAYDGVTELIKRITECSPIKIDFSNINQI